MAAKTKKKWQMVVTHWLKVWKDLHFVELTEIKCNITGLFMCACVHMIYDLSEGHKPLQPSMGRKFYQYYWIFY